MATVAAAAKPSSKIYVVTGATDGIGRLTAQKLGQDGLTSRCTAEHSPRSTPSSRRSSRAAEAREASWPI